MKSLSLKLQITLLVLMLVAGLVAAFSWTVATREKSMIKSEFHKKIILQARNIALSSSKALLHEDPEFELHPLIKKVMDSEKHIVSISVVDRSDIIRGHEDVLMIEKKFRRSKGFQPIGSKSFLEEGESLVENESLMVAEVPIVDKQEVIGFVNLSYSTSEIKDAVTDINSRMLHIGVIAMVSGALIAYLLALHITRPVKSLERGVNLIGKGRLDTRIKFKAVKELQVLAEAFNGMAGSLEKTREALRENERMEKELEIAREIQTTLLPSHLPEFPDFEIDALYNPSAQVGGDYFDIINVDENRVFLIVGDVSGKGVPGLVVMAMVRILLRGLAAKDESPAGLLRKLNLLLRKDMKRNMFVTLFCGILDRSSSTMRFASAAHMPLVVYNHRENQVKLLKTRTRPLGMFRDKVFTSSLDERKCELGPGDLIFQFTDGLNEARNQDEEEFGLERVKSLVRRYGKSGAKQLIANIREQLAIFRGDRCLGDDLTLLAVSVIPAGNNRDSGYEEEYLDRTIIE